MKELTLDEIKKVQLDIFPIDYLPENDEEEYYNKAKNYMYCLYNCLTDIAFVHEKRYMRIFNVVSEYDIMLRSKFGDYMKLPPEGERVSNHDFIAYWKENGE